MENELIKIFARKSSTLMRSASDNCLDRTSFPNSWPTNSTTGRGSMNAAEAISKECNKRMYDESKVELHFHYEMRKVESNNIPILRERPI